MKSGKSKATTLAFPLFSVLLSFFLLPFSFFPSPVRAQHAPHSVPSIPQELLERPVTIRTGIGTAHDDAGSKSPEAQRFYDQGLAYLHNYVWIEAARSFNQALRLDANLALAHVGLSYAYIELNLSAKAMQAIASAQAMMPRPGDSSAEARSAKVDHIRKHVESRSLQMAAEDGAGDASKLAAYRKSLDAAIAAFPGDAEFLLRRGIQSGRAAEMWLAYRSLTESDNRKAFVRTMLVCTE